MSSEIIKVKHTAVMTDIITESKSKKVAEIGIWKGSSTRKVLKACGEGIDEYWAIDQWAVLGQGYGRMAKRTIENWDEMYYYACNLMTWFPQLRVIRMESTKAATLFKDGYFDLVYIDADHYYEFAHADIKAWLPKVKLGGIISGHDYNSKQHVGVKKAVDEIFGMANIRFYDNGSEVWTKRV
jgi:predicted O-methyltransferase YrrM